MHEVTHQRRDHRRWHRQGGLNSTATSPSPKAVSAASAGTSARRGAPSMQTACWSPPPGLTSIRIMMARHLGCAARAFAMAWRRHGGDGQLRRRFRARQARSPRMADQPDGGRRGHSERPRWPKVFRGDGRPSPNISTYLRDAAHARYRHPANAWGAARLCHGRARRQQRSRHRPTISRRWPRWRARPSSPARSASPPRALPIHVGNNGEPVPGTYATEIELLASRARSNRPDADCSNGSPPASAAKISRACPQKSQLMHRIPRPADVPITFLLAQHNADR